MPLRYQMWTTGRGQFDMAHPLAPDLGARDFDSATFADDALETDPLVLTAIALPVLGRAEDLFAEKAVLFRAVASGS